MRITECDPTSLRQALTLAGVDPVPRREAIAASIEEVRALPGADVPAHSLGAALGRLNLAHDGDDTVIGARRRTCWSVSMALEIVLTGDTSYHGGSYAGVPVEPALPWFQAQIDAWADSDDARHKAMAATARRERDELLMTFTTRPG